MTSTLRTWMTGGAAAALLAVGLVVPAMAQDGTATESATESDTAVENEDTTTESEDTTEDKDCHDREAADTEADTTSA